MKKSKDDEMRQEYNRKDLGTGIRSKHFDAYQKSHNVVVLRPEVARAVPNG